MNPEGVNIKKRRFLLAATTAVGGIATVATAVPFVISMMPSQRAKAAGAPIEADISKIEPGMMAIFEWRGKPIWVVNRTPEMVAQLSKLDAVLEDPQSQASEQPAKCQNPHRSLKPQTFVAIGICTHLGCSPTYRKEVGAADLGTDWPGGFFCPCHGSKFDMAGRVFKDVPAPKNLEIPVHTYLSDTRLLIGDESRGA